MRVLLTTDTVGGVWTFTRELAAGLLDLGHAVSLVSLGRTPSRCQQEWTQRTSARWGAAFHYKASDVPLEWMIGNSSAYCGAEGLLLRMVGEFQADIVHASQFCFGALPVHAPKIVTAHSDVLTWAEACRPGGLEESEWLHQYTDLVIAGMAGADVIVTPTHWMREALARNFPASAGAHVIPNGRSVNPNERCEPRRLQAVTVGRTWDQAKGLTVLNEIDACMPVLVAGETYFEDGRAPHLGTAVERLGKLDEDDVLEVFRRSSLFLATSIYEPFGLAPLEAALCGCGVVARDIASLHEVWGDAAVYFTDGKDLSKIMARLSSSRAELEALQDRCAKRAQEFSARRMVDGYIAKYQDLLPVTSMREEVVAHGA